MVRARLRAMHTAGSSVSRRITQKHVTPLMLASVGSGFSVAA